MPANRVRSPYARAASGHAAAAPPTSASSRRFMSDMGPPPGDHQQLTEPCCRTLSLPQGGRKVIEADLNCSELSVDGRLKGMKR